jgi:phage terminase large subunit-like protein
VTIANADFPAFAATVGLELEPFQRRIADAINGPQRETVVLLPRGNGKTSLLAAVALHHLLTVEFAAVYCAAASREQARILFEAAAMYARTLGHPNIVDRHLELRYCPNPDKPRAFTRHLRVLAAEARLLHGLKPSLVVIDEMHSHPDDSVYVALRTAMLKKPGRSWSRSPAPARAPTRRSARCAPARSRSRRSPAAALSSTRAARPCACSNGRCPRTPTSRIRGS